MSADVESADVDAAHQARAERAEPVLPFDAEHRAGVGVGKIVDADVVGAGESGQVIPHVVGAHAPRGSTHDGRELPLVVHELAIRGPHELAPVRV